MDKRTHSDEYMVDTTSTVEVSAVTTSMLVNVSIEDCGTGKKRTGLADS